jgi:hypothetical protein
MFITKGHFLSPYAKVYKDGEILGMLHSVDTDLLVAIRIVGFEQNEQNEGSAILDLVKIDKVAFSTQGMPSQIKELLPKDVLIEE